MPDYTDVAICSSDGFGIEKVISRCQACSWEEEFVFPEDNPKGPIEIIICCPECGKKTSVTTAHVSGRLGSVTFRPKVEEDA